MELTLQRLIIPNHCKGLQNTFSTYDPEIEYSEEKNLFYLTEDLLQIECGNLILDLGWYGEISLMKENSKSFSFKNMIGKIQL